ncbi:MAG: polysaccharide biosynthesis protein [Erythrobacter sp.]|nr:polysaccharide biosynthesis protein [Erythrobacter sp.]
MRINLCYLFKQHRIPDLENAERFTEMVQLRKLHDRDPRHPVLMDKIAAKRLVADALGEDWVVPIRWQGADLPETIPFACPAILKARHGCNQYRVLRTAPTYREWEQIRRTASRWMRREYGGWLDEWGYRDTPRGLLAEPLLNPDGALPVDYKIYVFGGQATHVQVHLDRAGRHRWVLHDRDWRQLVPGADAPLPPVSLSSMLAAAEQLASGYDFLRVDFYEVEGRPLFGEFCLYPGSGLDPFAADWVDFELGALWRAARASTDIL